MRRGRGEFRPSSNKQLRVIPSAVIHHILKEPFEAMEKEVRQQEVKKLARQLVPVWQKEWLEIKEKYPLFSGSIHVTSYTQDVFGVHIPAGFPSGGPSLPDVPRHIEVPKIPADPLPYLTSELAHVFPSLTRYIQFYYSSLNITIPDPKRPLVDYEISTEFRDIVKQATAHLTVLRSNDKKGVKS